MEKNILPKTAKWFFIFKLKMVNGNLTTEPGDTSPTSTGDTVEPD